MHSCDGPTDWKRTDLTTRRGLKKVHVDFERIYNRMNTVYDNNLDKEKITGGIVGIWAKMCTDSILRNKLFEKGKVWRNTSEPPRAPTTRGVYLNRPSSRADRVASVYRFFREALAAPR